MKYLIFTFVFLLPFILFPQTQRCSTDEYREGLREKKSIISHSYSSLKKTNQFSGNIPIVVHILYNNENQNISNERVYSQIDVLNADFTASNSDLLNVPDVFIPGNMGISFCLVQSDLNGNNFSGINRVFTDVESFSVTGDAMKQSSQGGVNAWDPENYLNIWVCNLSGNSLGFATMPGDVSLELDGVVIDYEYFGVDETSSSPYNLGRTATHEIGHYFNLEHIFYAGCSDWDGCADTPATTSANYGCPEYPQESCQTIDMTMNFMDYVNDACMYMFTPCQVNRMLSAISNFRPNLLSTSEDCSISISEMDESVIIYPNPCNDYINIVSHNTKILLFDIYGRQVLSKYIQDQSTLDLSKFPPGTYILRDKKSNYPIFKQ